MKGKAFRLLMAAALACTLSIGGVLPVAAEETSAAAGMGEEYAEDLSYEAPTSVQSAADTVPGVTYSQSITKDHQYYYYKITLAHNGKVDVHLSSTSDTLYLEMLTEDGSRMNDWYEASQTFRNSTGGKDYKTGNYSWYLEKGTYLFSIRGVDSTYGNHLGDFSLNYELSYPEEDYPNGADVCGGAASTTACDISTDASYRDQISWNGSSKWYRFSIPDDQKGLHITLNGKNSKLSATVYKANDVNTPIYRAKDVNRSSASGEVTVSRDVAIKKGTYLLQVSGDHWTTGSYSFGVYTDGDPSVTFGFRTINGKQYWYEGGVRQGTSSDVNGVVGDGTIRGREIYDPDTEGWYWLDAAYDGAKAVNKEVWMPYLFQNEAPGSSNGKWVRYDANGAMIKEWLYISGDYTKIYPEQTGNHYYYDPVTGAMYTGWHKIEYGGRVRNYHFDENTGVCLNWSNW